MTDFWDSGKRNGVQLDAVFLKLLVAFLQLDQLRHARRSPNGGTVKDNSCLSGSPVLVEMDLVAESVGQGEIRQAFADLRAGGGPLWQTRPPRMADRRRRFKTQFICFGNGHSMCLDSMATY